MSVNVDSILNTFKKNVKCTKINCNISEEDFKKHIKNEKEKLNILLRISRENVNDIYDKNKILQFVKNRYTMLKNEEDIFEMENLRKRYNALKSRFKKSKSKKSKTKSKSKKSKLMN
jgi:hypothetical protein